MPDTLTLVLSNSADATADYLCERLTQAALPHRRFDTDLPLDSVQVRMQGGDLEMTWAGATVRPDQVRAVVYRRPKPLAPPVHGDEYQQKHAAGEWAEAIEGFLSHIPVARWINHPSRNYDASHKVHQLTRAREAGLITPAWRVTSVPAEARRFLDEHGPELVVKPLASGYIEREIPADDTLLYTHAFDKSHASLFDRLPACPVLFQTRVKKRVDVRLTIVDRGMVAVALQAGDAHGNQRLDIRRQNMCDVAYAPIGVPPQVATSVHRLMAEYGLRFAAIDFAIDTDGQWVFFEINPNGQWAWLDQVGGADVGQLFIDALRYPMETA